jgi:hypothetical protein
MKNAIVTMYYFRSQDFLDVGVRLEIECATSSDRKNLKKNSFFLSFFVFPCFHPVKVARDYATSVPSSDQSARWSEQQQHGAEVIHGFFPCSQQALPPQVPPRPPERSFHNYSNLSNLKPSYGASSSSLAIARYYTHLHIFIDFIRAFMNQCSSSYS